MNSKKQTGNDGADCRHSHESVFTAERIRQCRMLWKEAYEQIVPTMMEENHTIPQVAVIFFELGFRAADENPPEKKGSPAAR